MNRYLLLVMAVICLICPNSTLAQGGWLPNDFHQANRDALRKKMPPNSVAVLFANPVRNRANDVDYVYHQDPDFYYLTGLREPHSMILLFATPQEINEKKTKELIVVQPRDARSEMWNGARLGIKGVEEMGFEMVISNQEFATLDIRLGDFDKVIFHPLRDDIHNTKDTGDLYDLQQAFSQKANIPPFYTSLTDEIYELIKKGEGKASVAKVIGKILAQEPSLADDPHISLYLESDGKEQQRVAAQTPELNLDTKALASYLNILRETKSPQEISLLRKAIQISAQGQIEVMKAMHPSMSEREVQGIHELVFKKYGAEYEGYPSIVGAGNNGCVLHYITNDRPKVDANLVLMDLGAQYRGYTADVTRTIPANGKFSPEQRAIYELVYQAQTAGFEECKPNNAFYAPHLAATKVITKGLLALGIITKAQDASLYFPHGSSHYLGLDVHDRGTYGSFQPNTVITVEPGIYIPEGSPCDPKWWGIAVRIEDDILITDQGWENLSGAAPRKWQEIEALMAEPSPLDDFLLPEIAD